MPVGVPVGVHVGVPVRVPVGVPVRHHRKEDESVEVKKDNKL